MRSAIKNATRKKKKQKNQNKNFTAKTHYLNSEAPFNNVKMQSDKTLATQIHSCVTTQQIGFFLNGTKLQVDKNK